MHEVSIPIDTQCINSDFLVDLEKLQYTTYGNEKYRAVRDSMRCTSTDVTSTKGENRVVQNAGVKFGESERECFL